MYFVWIVGEMKCVDVGVVFGKVCFIGYVGVVIGLDCFVDDFQCYVGCGDFDYGDFGLCGFVVDFVYYVGGFEVEQMCYFDVGVGFIDMLFLY